MSHLKTLTPSNSSSLFIKDFPSQLPSRVHEVLSTSNLPLKTLTVRISKSGWAWFVIGRRLFIWRYLDDITGSSSKPKRCCELLLPPSLITHKAELVCVLNPKNQKQTRFPSALAVSPEGSIRYWPDIFKENNSIDSPVTADLNGQECQILIDIQPLGCILGTTTNSIVHIYLDLDGFADSQNQTLIRCNTFKTPQGIFSGISRKFSSFIFGTLPTATQYSESRQLIKVIRSEPLDDNDAILPAYIYVLCNCSIQKWSIEDFNLETFCGEIDLEKHLKETFISKFWNRSTTPHSQVSIWIMDMALNQYDELILLVMANNSDVVPNGNYLALITLSRDIFPTEETMLDQSSSTATSLNSSLMHSFVYLREISLSIDNDQQQLFHQLNNNNFSTNFNLIVDTNMSQVYYVYNSTKFYRITPNAHQQELITEINFNNNNDYLLGATLIQQNLLLFTFKKGFITINSGTGIGSLNLTTTTTKQQLLTSKDQEMLQQKDVNKFSIFKHALNLYVQHQQQQQQQQGEQTSQQHAILLIQEMFPFLKSINNSNQENIKTTNPIGTTELDEIVCHLSEDILNQIPSSDPRWANFSTKNSIETSIVASSVSNVNTFHNLITEQLEEKFSRHNLFIDLLKLSNAWNSLTSLTTMKSILPTKLIVYEHQEKLLACLVLRKLQQQQQQQNRFLNILENGIKIVLEKRHQNQSKNNINLTNQDLFYREVTKMDELFWILIELEEFHFNSMMNTGSHSGTPDEENFFITITDLFISVFSEICLYRQSKGIIYQSAIIADCDYVPWSNEQHIAGIRETLLKQFDILIRSFRLDSHNNTLILNYDEDQRMFLGQKLSDLADIILDSFYCQLNYLNPSTEKYSTLKRSFELARHLCLETLLRIKQFDKTASLAEKYEDFDMLIKLCEELGNQDQLKIYLQRFADKGFSEYLFEWYLREGKQGKMLATLSTSTTHEQKLDTFLSNHDSLKWLHQIHLKKYKEASQTLKKLSQMEENYPARKQTMLCLAKLALIVAGEERFISDINEELHLLSLQFELSDEILKKNNLDRKNMKVFSAEQLVDILLNTDVVKFEEKFQNYHKALVVADNFIKKSCPTEIFEQFLVKILEKTYLLSDWNDEYGQSRYSEIQFLLDKVYVQRDVETRPKKLPIEFESIIKYSKLFKDNQKAYLNLKTIFELTNRLLKELNDKSSINGFKKIDNQH